MFICVEKKFFNNNDPELLKKIYNCNSEFLYIEEVTEEKENIVFILDFLGSNIILDKNIDEKTKTIIKNIKNKALLITHHGKSFDESNYFNIITSIKELIDIFSFNEKNIYFFVQLYKDVNNIKKFFPCSKVLAYDRWLHELYTHEILTFAKKEINLELNLTKKFSIFCNRYEDFRLKIFCELISNNLLTNFYYTFANFYNYPLEKMISEISEKYNDHRDVIENWLKNSPHTLCTVDIWNFYPPEIKEYLNKSKIHIVIESEPNSSSFLTEKTYKAILYKKPFILISQKNALKCLKEEGYKTFSPFINETYDLYDNVEDRLNAVIEEIKRLNSLSENELDNIVLNCQEIINYNLEKLYENISRPMPDEFKFKYILTFNHD